jgi:hypothetical protein
MKRNLLCLTLILSAITGLTILARAQEEEKSPAKETSSGGLSNTSAKPSATPASTSSAPGSSKTDSASTAAASGYPKDKPVFTAVPPKGWMVMYGSDNALQFWSDDSVVEVDLFKLLGATDDASSKQRLTDVAKGIADMSMGGNAKNACGRGAHEDRGGQDLSDQLCRERIRARRLQFQL